MNQSVRRTRNILLAVFGLGGLVVAGLTYTFWPSLVILLDPRRTGAHSIPSESMAPTLVPGDHFVTLGTDPATFARGMVIVFKLPDSDRVSRIAGLPGDTIELREGVVVINGQPVPQRPAGIAPVLADKTPAKMLSERFPGEVRSHRILDRGLSAQDDFPAVKVPVSALFVLSDNRDNAADSRIPGTYGGVGMVRFQQVSGRAESLYWAKDRTRIGKPIDPPPGGEAK